MLAWCLAVSPAASQESSANKAKEETAPVKAPTVSVTKHIGTFGGQRIAYTATAGETYLKDKDGTPKAAIFSTAYVKDGHDPDRPVTFLFNGGPGSGSVWLHMGAFGPKRVAIPSDARDDGGPPYPIVDNPDALLDVTDIVFIDPVGTGFSHALGKTDPKDYWGVTADAKSVAEFIRIWLTQNRRWNAPKYLGGESYGTTRSAAVANELEGAFNDISLNGIILISTILDFGAQANVEGNEMPYILFLPSMAAAAHFHGKVPDAPPLETFVDEARRFAAGEYATALLKGQALKGDERADIRRRLARYTGLSEQYLENADLRVTDSRFYKELLRDRNLTIGRLDARYTGRDFDNAGETPDNDPSFYGIDGGYAAAINSWVRDGLKFDTERQYVTIGSVGDWDWNIGGGDSRYYRSVAPYIARAMRENSDLRVFVGQGYYDFATPFFGAEYALGRTGFPVERIEYRYYGSGHMMYVRDEDRAALSRDVRNFIRAR
ncbi:peptidase S10 [Allosphingosinicella flava]|uniref:Peptidase S10 n=1 Tax=Allosphingosinicella flava TaxID=2771430 RepID=A0A7T2GJH3_9SPHN|nr:peptidase S10 [Sphingosinicella flava]QPQ55004.1 peptidase S10 [Sphingosinicella flava]